MRERDPVLLHRMLALRHFPIFAAPELEELANVAENVVELELARGETIAAAGARVDALSLIVEGRLAAGERAWGPRELFGLVDTLARRPSPIEVTAAAPTRVLRLSSIELVELLEDNHGLMTAALRELAARAARSGSIAADQPGDHGAAASLGLIERLRILRRQAPFATARLQALTRLAHGAEELRWAAGAEVVRAGEPARRAVMIVGGALRVRRPDGGSIVRRAGATIGLLETLAGAVHEHAVEAIAPVRALVAGGDELFDVVEDHPDLGLAMLRALAARVPD